MAKIRKFHSLPVVSLGAEFLVIGHLMRRNILAYKAPPNNAGYDLICVHPDPKYKPQPGQREVVRVQVKSRYATDCDRAFPVKKKTLDAFDFVVAAFLNIGDYNRGRDGSTGGREAEFYTLPKTFVISHYEPKSGWEKVSVRGLTTEIGPYKNEAGFEQIAEMLGIPKPTRRSLKVLEAEESAS